MDEKKLERFRLECSYRAETALRSFLWNTNRVAGIKAKDTPDEIKAKLVAVMLTKDPRAKRVARLRLALIEAEA